MEKLVNNANQSIFKDIINSELNNYLKINIILK